MAELKNATLIEIEFLENGTVQEKSDKSNSVEVQFNPESLKLTFANQIVQPQGGDQAAGSSGRQFVGAGTTKLALSLWFDVTAMEINRVDDVRRLTRKVIYFMTPAPVLGQQGRQAPPGVRFSWGSLVFDGMVESLEETLDFFSPDGKPLRAQIALTIGQQKILVPSFAGHAALPNRPGTKPLTPAKQGQSLQSMASAAPGAPAWQDVASANGIEDPLRLAPGKLIDLNVAVRPPSVSVSAGAGVNLRLGS